ncbi:MAG: hypothetical protein IJ802_06110 [Kiritimatiellae bacterium]|nr:hypothetical protein [Kiritimatiellia bacterium]
MDCNDTAFAAFAASCEAAHTQRIARIAERVAARAPIVRLVLVSGPSSAGKTTTAIRLVSAMEREGIGAMRLSTDDYFVGNARNPRRADGEYDYETIEAVDSPRLRADLARLLAGEHATLRKFDFRRHEGFDSPEPVSLPPSSVIVLEGIHALNPILTEGMDELCKFRVYINVLTAPEPFTPEEIRLVRRLVRDRAHRASSAQETFAAWPFVLEGEEKWINPTRRYADAVFNTALAYEPHITAKHALPLLEEAASLPAARALAAKFAHFAPQPDSSVPGDSLLRETIGGGVLEY